MAISKQRKVVINSAEIALRKNKAIPLAKARGILIHYTNLLNKVRKEELPLSAAQEFYNLLEAGAIISKKLNIHADYLPHFKSAYLLLSCNLEVVSWKLSRTVDLALIHATDLYFKQLYLLSWGELEEVLNLKDKNFLTKPKPKLYCNGDFDNEPADSTD